MIVNCQVIYNWEEALGIVIKEGYGQTETTLLCGTFKKVQSVKIGQGESGHWTVNYTKVS